MENYLECLNKEQYRAVTTPSQYVRVIAGAGSGKTRVLTTRIVYAVKEWGIDPSKVIAITFTNKAAAEMKQRVNTLMQTEGTKMQISTIHSFCVTVLRQEIARESYPRNFTILDPDDQKSIIKEAFKELNFDSKDFNMSSILDYIGNNKGAGFGPERALEVALSPIEEKKAKIYAYYCERQHNLYALDFDDLLLWTIRIFRKYPNVRSKWQQKYQFLLVDEFQDIDAQQYELIHLLANEDTYVYVVGDPDQTIYSWRGADINIIMNFNRDFKDAETILLTQNYRSTGNILAAANSLIKFNKNRLEKDLITKNEDGKKLVHYCAPTDELEAAFVVKHILDLNKKGVEFNDCAVLYRNNYLSRVFEKQLMDLKVPYIIYGGIRFYERQEIKDALSYLRMLVSGDDLSYKRVINVPKRGIGNKTIDTLLEYARDYKCTMYEASKRNFLPPKSQKTLNEFSKMVEDWKQRSATMTLETILQMIIDESGYRTMLETSADPKDQERLENLKELINDIEAFQGTNPDATLDDYLQMVTLYTDIQSQKDGKFVSLMTIHAAKGLEFKNVFVVGMSEGIFPSQRTLEDGLKGLEEERRLAYVAFTRARERLYLSDNNGYSYATAGSKSTSRFINEIDESLIQTIGMSEPEKKVEVSYQESPVTSSSFSRVKAKVQPGDIMIHDDFGEGVVRKISKDGKFADIAFAYPFKTKTMSLTFHKLHKKEN